MTSLPRAIGRYEILGLLATGGMAEILLGRLMGPSGFERVLVLKRILPHLARGKQFVAMFIDEARIAAKIRHPNVVVVHELGRVDDELFLAMEYVEGESLAGLLRRLWSRDLDLGPALSAYVVAQACAGLHAAHELESDDGTPQNLVHRDVSPQNVMVTYTGEVKVLDFGIAKAADRLAKTETGQLKGKYEYMSPEQCLGKPIDRRVDVFALGTILYELSTSRRLFKRSNSAATIRAICEESITAPRELASAYPASLERVCLRALARDPGDRYASAAQMRRELVTVLHEIAGDRVHEEALGELMQTLFADRIRDKREMLRRAREGQSVAGVPEAEVDADVDLPSVHDANPGRTHPPRAATPSARHRGSLGSWTLAAVAGVAVLGAGAVALGLRGTDAPTTAAPEDGSRLASSSMAGERPSEPPPPPTADAGGDVVVRVESTPAGARVLIDGDDRGATPIDVRVAKAAAAVALEVRATGFAPYRGTFVPDIDQRLVLELHRVTAGSGAPAPRSRSKPAAAATTKPIPFERFE